jgi:acyl-CoA synthetase (AMP-forming)/AMP-acid ligase II
MLAPPAEQRYGGTMAAQNPMSAAPEAFALNASEMLFTTAASAGDRPAVIDGHGEVSYRQLAERSLNITAALVEAGVAANDRVGILLRRGADAAAAFFGVLAAGAIAVIVNEQLRPRQIEHILGHSGAAALLHSAEIIDRLPRTIDTRATLVELGELPSGAGVPRAPRVGSDVAQIVYTSGSTGLPKGVTFSHANVWSGMKAVVTYLGISSRDRIASLLPFSFDYGLNQLLCAAGTGAALVVERSPVPARIVRTLAERRASVVAGVPPLWLQLLGCEPFRSEALPALRVMTNSGGRIPTDGVRNLRRFQPHAKLVLMYGLTEAFRSTYLPPERVDRKPNSMGQAIPGAEILVVRDDLSPAAPGEVGQLVHRGPTVALGYWDDPTATARVYRPNPLRPSGTPDSERVVFSGDLVYRDEEGDLFFVGREDAMIKTLGYRVSPDEVTDVIYASGEVVEAIVSSEPDELRGARIVAYVVLAEHGALERLEAFVAGELPRHMQPSRIDVRQELRRTTSGKHDLAGTAREAK